MAEKQAKQAKNKGTPYPGMPLYLIIYIELSQVLHHTP